MQFDQINQVIGGQGTPSLSPTPSPAGSVGSVGSQSSGYGSGELASRGNNSNNLQAPAAPISNPTCMVIPLNVYQAMSKENQITGYISCFEDLWIQADNLIRNGNSLGKTDIRIIIFNNKKNQLAIPH